MGEDSWQDLYEAWCAEQLGSVNDYQQNYYPPSSPVNWDEDPPPVVTQYHLMCGRDPTSNDQMPTLAHLHDARFSQSLFPSEMTYELPENDQRDVYIATGQPLPNASFNHLHSPVSDDPFVNNLGFPGNVSGSYPIEGYLHPVHDNQSESRASDYLCKWNDDHGSCNMTMNEEEITNHLLSSHLPPPGRTRMKCRWEGCKRRLICRDTVIRHIRQIHLGIGRRHQP